VLRSKEKERLGSDARPFCIFLRVLTGFFDGNFDQ